MTRRSRARKDDKTATYNDDARGGKPAEPVLSLLLLPLGPLHRLDDIREDDGSPARVITIGAHAHSDIAITRKRDDTVSRNHCILYRLDDGRVEVRDDQSKNRTLVGGVPLRNGSGELLPGMVLTLGATDFLACGTAGAEQEPLIPARDPVDLARKAVAFLGTQTRAAKALKMAQQTVSDWLAHGMGKRRKQA